MPKTRAGWVERWVKPAEFVELREEAPQMGFAGAMSGPLVRSSYRGGRLYARPPNGAERGRGGAFCSGGFTSPRERGPGQAAAPRERGPGQAVAPRERGPGQAAAAYRYRVTRPG